MSTVFLAEHQLIKRKVAIKILRPAARLEPKALERFRQEAKVICTLEAAGIVKVYDFGVSPQGDPFLVMEYLQGETLAAVLAREGKLPVRRALEIFLQLCDALSAAHSVGIIHRDIKASNIMLTSDDSRVESVKLLDFGIAKAFDPSGGEMQQLTATGQTFASPVNMSPEQYLGRTVDCRSDLYSLGCVMYQALSGSTPFPGSGPAEIASAHIAKMPPPLSTLDASLPPTLDSIVQKAIKKQPAERFQSTEELSGALRQQASSLAESTPAALPTGNRKSKQKKLMLLVVAIGLLLSCAAAFLISDLGALTLTRLQYSILELSRLSDDSELLQTGLSLCKKLLAAKEYSAASTVGLSLEPVFEKQFKAESTELVELRTLIAQALSKEGNQTAALRQAEIASHALRDRVTALLSMSNNKEAEPLAKSRMNIVGQYYPDNSRESLETRQILAVIYLSLAKYAEVSHLIDGIFASLNQNIPEEGQYLCFFLQDKAVLFEKTGDLPKSEVAWKKIIEIGKTLPRSSEYLVNSAYRNIANLMLTEGRLQEAEQYAKNALKGDRRWGQVLCLLDLTELGNIYTQMKDYVRTKETFEEGVKLCTEHPEIDHASRRAFYREYASYLRKSGEFEASKRFFQRADDSGTSPPN